MKFLFWIVGVPLLLVAAFFAVANRELVTVSLWPLADPIELPLFAAIVGPLYVGVIIGAIAAWWSGRHARRRARRAERHVATLEHESAVLKTRLTALEAAKPVERPADAATQAPAHPLPAPSASVLH